MTKFILQPRDSPRIIENLDGGTLVTDGIIATDPDTDADLKFSIDWDTSYATKSGQEANKTLFEKYTVINQDILFGQNIFKFLIYF